MNNKYKIAVILFILTISIINAQPYINKLLGRWDMLYYTENKGPPKGIGDLFSINILSSTEWIVRIDQNQNKKYDPEETTRTRIKITDTEIISYLESGQIMHWSSKYDNNGSDVYLIVSYEDSDGNLGDFHLRR